MAIPGAGVAAIMVPAAVVIPAAIVVPIPSTTPATAFMLPAFVLKTSVVKIGSVISFKPGTIVFEVDMVTVVAVPGRVVIINIAGEFGFTNLRGGIIPTTVLRCLFGVYWCRLGVNRSRCDIHPGTGDTETDMGIYIYL